VRVAAPHNEHAEETRDNDYEHDGGTGVETYINTNLDRVDVYALGGETRAVGFL
jgi:hypothetical protein